MRVKLAAEQIANVRPSLSSGMRQPAIQIGFGVQQRAEHEPSDDRAHQPAQIGVLYLPK